MNKMLLSSVLLILPVVVVAKNVSVFTPKCVGIINVKQLRAEAHIYANDKQALGLVQIYPFHKDAKIKSNGQSVKGWVMKFDPDHKLSSYCPPRNHIIAIELIDKTGAKHPHSTGVFFPRLSRGYIDFAPIKGKHMYVFELMCLPTRGEKVIAKTGALNLYDIEHSKAT